MQEVASSTQTHAAHARAHASRHAKPQHGSDFAAMLDEMAAEKADASAEPATPPSTQASVGQPQAASKAAEAGQSGQTATPSAAIANPEPSASAEQAIKACLDPAQPQQDPAASQKVASVLPAAPETNVPPKDEKAEPVVSDKPALAPTLLTQPAGPAPNGTPQPPAAPAQPPVPPGQALQPSDTPALPPGLAIVAPAARQISAEIKPAKQGQAPAQLVSDDQAPTGVLAPEQAAPLPAGGKPASAAVGAEKPEDVVDASHRATLDLASAKPDAPQPIDDLLNQTSAQGDASAANNGASASATNQTGSAAPAMASNTPAPPSQLGPVPLSGIPVLIAGKAIAGSNHFDIRLDPPDLGRIEVRLKVDRDGQVSSHLIADRADTLALLRRDQTGLERALQDAGLKTTGDGLQFSLRDQGGNGQPDGRSAAPTLIVQDNLNPTTDLLPRGYGSYSVRAGGVDIHV